MTLFDRATHPLRGLLFRDSYHFWLSHFGIDFNSVGSGLYRQGMDLKDIKDRIWNDRRDLCLRFLKSAIDLRPYDADGGDEMGSRCHIALDGDRLRRLNGIIHDGHRHGSDLGLAIHRYATANHQRDHASQAGKPH